MYSWPVSLTRITMSLYHFQHWNLQLGGSNVHDRKSKSLGIILKSGRLRSRVEHLTFTQRCILNSMSAQPLLEVVGAHLGRLNYFLRKPNLVSRINYLRIVLVIVGLIFIFGIGALTIL